jgi:hypothetical protein
MHPNVAFLVAHSDNPSSNYPPMEKKMPFRPVRAGLLLAAACAFAAAAPAIASESACYSIRDSDRRNMCLAQAKRQDSYCHSIRNSDDRHMCLAVIKKRRSDCYSIRSNDQRNMCLAQVK